MEDAVRYFTGAWSRIRSFFERVQGPWVADGLYIHQTAPIVVESDGRAQGIGVHHVHVCCCGRESLLTTGY